MAVVYHAECARVTRCTCLRDAKDRNHTNLVVRDSAELDEIRKSIRRRGHRQYQKDLGCMQRCAERVQAAIVANTLKI